MGIQGLLLLLAEIVEKTHLGLLGLPGKKVAFDGPAFLHRGSISCAREICLGIDTKKYVNFCMSIIRLFTDKGVRASDCYVVFDNKDSSPLKLETNEVRRDARARALERATAQERIKGPTSEVCALYKAAVSISTEMISALQQACIASGVNVIVAPNEADSQLAYLSQSGTVDYVVGEDSDFLAFGAKACIYKLQGNGACDVVRSENLGQVFPNWTLERFVLFCILSGCDYLKIPNIGPKMAMKIVSQHPTLAQVKQHLRSFYQISAADLLRLSQALLTFQHSAPLNLLSPLPAEPVLRKILETDSSRGGALDLTFLGSVAVPLVESRRVLGADGKAPGVASCGQAAVQSQGQRNFKEIQWLGVDGPRAGPGSGHGQQVWTAAAGQGHESDWTAPGQGLHSGPGNAAESGAGVPSSTAAADWGFEYCEARGGNEPQAEGAKKPARKRKNATPASGSMETSKVTMAMSAFQSSVLAGNVGGALPGFVSLRRQLFNSRSATAIRDDTGAPVHPIGHAATSAADSTAFADQNWIAEEGRGGGRGEGGGGVVRAQAVQGHPPQGSEDCADGGFFEAPSFFHSTHHSTSRKIDHASYGGGVLGGGPDFRAGGRGGGGGGIMMGGGEVLGPQYVQGWLSGSRAQSGLCADADAGFFDSQSPFVSITVGGGLRSARVYFSRPGDPGGGRSQRTSSSSSSSSTTTSITNSSRNIPSYSSSSSSSSSPPRGPGTTHTTAQRGAPRQSTTSTSPAPSTMSTPPPSPTCLCRRPRCTRLTTRAPRPFSPTRPMSPMSPTGPTSPTSSTSRTLRPMCAPSASTHTRPWPSSPRRCRWQLILLGPGWGAGLACCPYPATPATLRPTGDSRGLSTNTGGASSAGGQCIH